MEKKPTVVLVIGMAGTGKTALMQRLAAHCRTEKIASYLVNLDPAVYKLGYEPNIDIRDTVSYRDVMEQYNLGPNGAILTSLNLFATKFNQVLDLLEKRASELDYIFIDTPGQIEVTSNLSFFFDWWLDYRIIFLFLMSVWFEKNILFSVSLSHTLSFCLSRSQKRIYWLIVLWL